MLVKEIDILLIQTFHFRAVKDEILNWKNTFLRKDEILNWIKKMFWFELCFNTCKVVKDLIFRFATKHFCPVQKIH